MSSAATDEVISRLEERLRSLEEQSRAATSGQTAREDVEAKLKDLEARIGALIENVYKLLNIYSVFLGVIIAAVVQVSFSASPASSKCSQRPYFIAFSVVPFLVYGIPLMVMASKYVELEKQHDRYILKEQHLRRSSVSARRGTGISTSASTDTSTSTSTSTSTITGADTSTERETSTSASVSSGEGENRGEEELKADKFREMLYKLRAGAVVLVLVGFNVLVIIVCSSMLCGNNHTSAADVYCAQVYNKICAS